eukprot:CAMPEP_0178922358 /NCGR_PEP_ID=MMETSP0786-20121207/16106_1 /TAXON_ID=186022 /ORGANISM="Thalassionema frauenfeldii, Strain CCMP 1798" /LENGTH=668 /DNA_ID=CAMNT_0020596707 /DNA_START=785 /DNA_END=2788 /DNA_ORIENTATION=+
MLTTKPTKDNNSSDNQLLSDLQNMLRPKEVTEVGTDTLKLPSLIRKLNKDEIRLLWAIGEINLNPPKYTALDVPGQLALFCFTLFDQLKAAMNEEEETMNDDEEEEVINGMEPNEKIPSESSSFIDHFSRRQSFNLSDDAKVKPVAVAAACALAALTSNHQRGLVDKARPDNEKIDWDRARSLRLPFWVRSDDELCKLSCEIGLAVYRQTRDIMESAIFFIIAGNMKTLKNLAATDGSLSGTKFLKFINSYDFSSQRGRKAAEKNAFSLLRKNRYRVSAALFLMAEPPMLNTAIETITAKSQDYDLAFLTTRLVEKQYRAKGQNQFGGLRLGAIGDGGGFAGNGISGEIFTSDENVYEEWRPKLGHASKQLLREKGVDFAKADRCLQALQLIWLDRQEEAARLLSSVDKLEPKVEIFLKTFDTPIKLSLEDKTQRGSGFAFHAPVKKCSISANDRVIEKANSVINFVSRPLLVKSMKCSIRSRWAATLILSNILIERGMEVASARCILQNTTKNDYAIDGIDNQKSKPTQKAVNNRDPMSSSIFDGFDVAPAKPIPKPDNKNDPMSSSIFDGFGAAPAKPIQKPDNTSDLMSSSIFDGFDAAPTKPIPKPDNNSDPMSSSIFDGFDAAPAKPIPKPDNNSDPMSSSIFDGFDAAPAKPIPKPDNNSDP